MSDTTTTLSIQVDFDKNNSIKLSDLLSKLSDEEITLPKVFVSSPANLDISLKSVSFNYTSGGGGFFFSATSISGNNLFGILLKKEDTKTYVLGIDLKIPIDLSEFPLVGHEIGREIQNFSCHLLYVSSDLNKDAFSTINNKLKNNNLATFSLPSNGGLSKGLSFQGKFRIKDLGKPFLLSAPVTSASSGVSTGSQGSSSSTSNNDNQGNINKTFGPVHIQSISMNFKEGDLNLITTGSIKMGPLALALDQLQISNPINEFKPEFDLKGLSLDYHKNDFSIEGAFLNQGGGEYSGMFGLSLTKLQLTAIGSYKNDNGNPSLFVYGLLDEPLGGPAFCFVEGVAIAFGYNRNFIAPPVTGISAFPLISAAAGGTPAQSTSGLATMMSTLDEYIPPKMGEYFVGLGMKFMSFKVINSFALLIVKFGDELEFDLLGESTYVAPNPKDPKPIATVELEIVGSYKPALGTLLIRGQLTPNSFVLSKKCHLEGGFAIAMWFKGNYNGDFCYTFGGYGKHYQPPKHYPQNIPQLGFLWQVNPEVSIKGGGYWAITPKELMVGGYLKAAYNSSGLRASFDIDAYFLISWSPLYYDAGFTVTFSLSVYIDLLFISGWIGFELSEGLEIHGPPFGGTAFIDLAVCTVHINFGAGPTPKPFLTGQQFREAFLPKSKTAESSSQILSINIVQGLVKKEKDIEGNELYFINPKELLITTESFVPCTGFNLNTNALTNGDNFEITPMGVDFDGTKNTSVHRVTINKEDKSVDNKQFNVEHSSSKDAPKSIWEKYTDDSHIKTIVTDKYESKLSPLIFGTDITPKASILVSSTSSVDKSVLANEDPKGNDFKWETVSTFDGTQEKVNTLTNTSIENTTYEYLDAVFDFGEEGLESLDGLSNRFKNMKPEIFVGSLNNAS